jgi:uncharacterized phage-associated protein
MFDAMDVARHLIWYGYDSFSPQESVYISPLRLQKFLYYCQGWSLGLLDQPLFSQPIEAWTYGPVVYEVFERFQGMRDGISPERAGEATALLCGVEAKLVEMIWQEYSRFTPPQLVLMTHGEPPWKEARGDLPKEAKSRNVISLKTMAQFFKELANRRGRQALPSSYPTIDPIKAWQNEKEFERSGRKTITAEDVFRDLLSEAGR